jgi:hypothetical protein
VKKSEGSFDSLKIEHLLRDLLITSLAGVGVKGGDIRKIVGCDMNRVTRIVAHIPQEKK